MFANYQKSQDGRGVEGLVRGGMVGGSGGIIKWGVRVQSGVSECMCK